MNYVHMFSYNIPADNQFCNRTDRYINIISEWDDKYIDDKGKPYLIYSQPINMGFSEAISVINWSKVKYDVDKIAEKHFTDIARQERINQARSVLQVEENPILQRIEVNEVLNY